LTVRAALLGLAVGLALADSSIVTLALPEILSELDTTVEGVAAVIGVYTVVLAAAVVPLERAATAFSVRAIGAGGLLLFAVASAACAGADDLTGLLISRAAQALGGAAGLVAAFALLGGGATPGRRAWVAAAVLGTAIGPALGGALTELFSWRAIFVFQAPVAGAAACWPSPGCPAPTSRGRWLPRRWPGWGWAWRSPRWRAVCCPSARRTTPRARSPSAMRASRSRWRSSPRWWPLSSTPRPSAPASRAWRSCSTRG
jgi:MFS family permease